MSDGKEVKVYTYLSSDPMVKASDHHTIVAELRAEVEALKKKAEINWDKWNYTQAEETIARQAREAEVSKAVIEKLKTMVSHYETCATVDCYDDEEVDCDCGLAKALAAIEGAEGEKE